MVSAFSIGAMEAGHEVISINVAHKNIKGCMACEYCREKEKGICVQKDDMQAIYPEILLADMVVFASPIYYFTLSAQLQAVIHRTYSIDIPKNVKKVALITTCGYEPEKGADLLQEGVRRYCKHSQLEFIGSLVERHMGYKTEFMDEEKEAHAKAFAEEVASHME